MSPLWILQYLLTPALPAPALAITVAPGETLTVRVTGAGPPVLVIPGLFGAAEGFRQMADGLSAHGYQVVVIEPLGIGTSARPRDADYSLTAQALRAAAVLDSLHAGSALVVAHSTGAAIAYRLAVLHPAAVRGIVSLEGGPVEHVGTPGLRRALSWAPLLRLLGAGAMRGRVAAQLRAASGDPSWVTDSVVDLYAAGPTRDLGATLRTLKRMVNAAEPWPLAPALGRITVPVHLVLGAAPHQSGPSEADVARLTQALARFTLERWEGVGHYAFAEAPGRVVDAVLRADRASAQP
jgi:pimeloyl-ACP methyl ester carboxylesterase